MFQITDKDAFLFLSRAGFARAEIERLCRFRRDYQSNEMDQAALDQRHLEFVRWLVTTGRLSEGLPEAQASAPPSPNVKHNKQSTASHARWTPSFFTRNA